MNIKDIAKAAGVSITTVSNVLNGKSNVGEEVRERIVQLCKDMDYHPNIMARNLKAGKTNTVMFCFSDFERTFYLRIIHGINDCLHEHGIGMIICTQSTIENFLRNGFVDGAIVLDQSVRDEQIIDAAGRGMSLVLMDRVLQSAHVSSVVTDNRESMLEMTETLVQKGKRRFCYVGGLEHTPDHQERFAAFKEVLHRHDIPFDEAAYYPGDYSIKSGVRAGNRLAMMPQLPQVVVCANDNMAVGVMRALQGHGIAVPEQVGVTGFDGDRLEQVPSGFLATASIRRYEMGYLAAETLVRMLKHEEGAGVKRIPAPVVWGGSVQ